MMIRVGINGLGRIGKALLREFTMRRDLPFEIVWINSNKLTPSLAAYMIKYDSVHGCFDAKVTHDESSIYIERDKAKVKNAAHFIGHDVGMNSAESDVDVRDAGGEILNGSGDRVSGVDAAARDEHDDACRDVRKIVVSSYSSISDIDWAACDVDIVLECTGIYNSREKAKAHIDSGAKKVIISAPAKNVDATIVYGVNESAMSGCDIVSAGSCTTNCFAPVLFALSKVCEIERGFMTTVHSYTNDQSIVDTRHSKDMRRGRAGAMSMIPTSTGAASSIGEIFPALKGRVSGAAIRVPVANVSMIDFAFTTHGVVTKSDINGALRQYAKIRSDVLSVNDDELVSSDFCGRRESAIFDVTQTNVIDDKFCRVVAWYDNEIGFANRMLDMCALFARECIKKCDA